VKNRRDWDAGFRTRLKTRFERFAMIPGVSAVPGEKVSLLGHLFADG
jgi:hypothetical protein